MKNSVSILSDYLMTYLA